MYDDGVGTSGFKPLRILGGAFGYGFSRNVRDLYQFLCRHYNEGDDIYIFGFSRGAFTARTLADFIVKCGILNPGKIVPGAGLSKEAPLNTDRGLKLGVKLAYESYRHGYKAPLANFCSAVRDFVRRRKTLEPSQFHQQMSFAESPVKFVGVWDTVDAVGMPIDELSTVIDEFIYPHRFPDQKLSWSVERARHAVAIDDERHTFHPVLWNEQGERDPDHIKQVWFSGMHSNVGGGYPDDGLANVPLRWMVNEAKRKPGQDGLVFAPEKLEEIEQAARPLGKMHDSRSGAAVYYRYKPRRIQDLCSDDAAGVKIEEPKIHHSVFDRIAAGTEGYAPRGLPANYRVVDENGNVSELNPTVLESDADRGDRAALLERCQSHIFWRRYLYFALLSVTLALLCLPYWEPPVPGKELSGVSDILGSVFGLVSPFVPDFLGYWVDTWTQAASWFVILAVAYGILGPHSRWVRGNTQQLAEAAWWHLRKPGGTKPSVPEEGLFERIATSLRGTQATKSAYRLYVRHAMPWLALVLSGLVVVGVILRVAVFAPAVGEGVCHKFAANPAGAADVDPGNPKTVSFDTKNTCLETGVRLIGGSLYEIRVDASNGDPSDTVENQSRPWRDKSLAAGPAGLSRFRDRLLLIPALPLRRKLSYTWFVLTAEIGRDSGETFPIRDESLKFRPRATGALFLYVNDAIGTDKLSRVLPSSLSGRLPAEFRTWDGFYNNNNGTAQITVTRLE